MKANVFELNKPIVNDFGWELEFGDITKSNGMFWFKGVARDNWFNLSLRYNGGRKVHWENEWDITGMDDEEIESLLEDALDEIEQVAEKAAENLERKQKLNPEYYQEKFVDFSGEGRMESLSALQMHKPIVDQFGYEMDDNGRIYKQDENFHFVGWADSSKLKLELQYRFEKKYFKYGTPRKFHWYKTWDIEGLEDEEIEGVLEDAFDEMDEVAESYDEELEREDRLEDSRERNLDRGWEKHQAPRRGKYGESIVRKSFSEFIKEGK